MALTRLLTCATCKNSTAPDEALTTAGVTSTLRVGAYPYVDVEDILSLAQQRNEKPFILILDLLKDPQNVGVLLRVAESVGVHGILIQERRSVEVT